MRITIETNFPQVQRALQGLQREVAQQATARALNATIAQARTQMSREIRQEFAVDTRFVGQRLRIKRATFFNGRLGLEAALDAQEKPRSANVIRFGAKAGKAGVTVKIKRGQPRKLIRNVFIGNKGRTVFTRQPGTKMASRKWGGKHGEQIEPVQTIDLPQMFNARRIKAAVVAAMQARFPAIFERELAFALSRFNR
jgi:hypothetical protein